MKTSLNFKISLRIILMFAIAITMSFIADKFHYELGDWFCSGNSDKIINKCLERGEFTSAYHNPTWHWGYRHFLLWWMGFFLFITQIVFCIKLIVNTHNQTR